MNRNLLIIAVLFIATQLVGCAGNVHNNTPAPVIENVPPTVTPEPSQPEKPVEPPVAPQPVTPVQPPAPAPSSKAVSSLVNQARAQYNLKNYQAAVATAERALKIDRRSPEVYLILAQSYVQMANNKLAFQFVQQGIRYAQAGTEMAQSLLQLRDDIPK